MPAAACWPTAHARTAAAADRSDPQLGDEPLAQIRLVRDHLDKEYRRFRAGEFDDLASIHGAAMPGLAELTRGYARIRMAYQPVPAGAEITFTTDDTTLVEAVHAWFDTQVGDHGKHAEQG